MSKRKTRGLVMVVALGASVASAGAQDRRTGNRLDAPLDASTKAAITAIVDSAKAQGLPVEPLNEKMYQGIAAGADGPRIVAAVRQLSSEDRKSTRLNSSHSS